MRLTNKNLKPYLLDKGFFSEQALMNGEIMSRQLMSRNSIFHAASERGGGHFIKQLHNTTSHDIYWMQKEATALYLLHNSDLYPKTKTHVPIYHGYDVQSHILVVGYFSNSLNLYDKHLKDQAVTSEYMRHIAEIFNSFHKDISNEIPNNNSLQFFNQELPGILTLPEFASHAGMGIVLNTIRENQTLHNALDRLRLQWNGNSLIHGDIKLVNFLVLQEQTRETIKLIDWETANIGDPLWDVAGLIQSYLAYAVFAENPKDVHDSNENPVQIFEMSDVEQALTQFWKTYTKPKKWSQNKRKEAAITCIEYSAARLLQTANEINQSDMRQLLPNTVKLIQFAHDVFEQPEKYAQQLLGEVS